jgi:hypothetical protein
MPVFKTGAFNRSATPPENGTTMLVDGAAATVPSPSHASPPTSL